MLVEDMSRILSGLNITCFFVLYPFVTYLLTVPCICTSHVVVCRMQAREIYSEYSCRVFEGLVKDTIQQCDGMYEPMHENYPIYSSSIIYSRE
jgi:hypothetical protein